MTEEQVKQWAAKYGFTKADVEFFEYMLGEPDEKCYLCKEIKIVAGSLFYPENDCPPICPECYNMLPDPPGKVYPKLGR